MTTTTAPITPAIRFAARANVASLPYAGAYSRRWAVETAGKVEAFPASYPAEVVAAAEALLVEAGTGTGGSTSAGGPHLAFVLAYRAAEEA